MTILLFIYACICLSLYVTTCLTNYLFYFDIPTPSYPLCLCIDTHDAEVRTTYSRDLAYDLAARSAILLHNHAGVLPLPYKQDKCCYTLGLIGSAAKDSPMVVGGGSGYVWMPPEYKTPFDYATPYILEKKGDYTISYTKGDNIETALSLAAQSKYVVLFTSEWSTEGFDRNTDLRLPKDQQNLVTALSKSAYAKKIILVHFGAIPIIIDGADNFGAYMAMGFSGVESSRALFELLFGERVPSGRLPVTFPRKVEDLPYYNNPSRYPGINNQTEYWEKELVGYKWAQKMHKSVDYWFGHGLSYSKIRYSDIKVNRTGRPINSTSPSDMPSPDSPYSTDPIPTMFPPSFYTYVYVTFTLTNEGKYPAIEVPQLYFMYNRIVRYYLNHILIVIIHV